MNYDEQHVRLVEYLHAKLAVEDWHGVRDVCVDIEVLEARMESAKGLQPALYKGNALSSGRCSEIGGGLAISQCVLSAGHKGDHVLEKYV